MRYAAVFIFVIISTFGYGQLGQAAGGFAQAQQQDLERKHQLQMQREAEQYALEQARIQAQSQAQAAQATQVQPFWESGNAFLQGCAAVLEKTENQAAGETESELLEGMTCMGFLRGFVEGINIGVYFAGANSKTPSPQPWCMAETVTALQAGLVLVKYIRNHPETSHRSTSLLAFSAYRDAFPCAAK